MALIAMGSQRWKDPLCNDGESRNGTSDEDECRLMRLVVEDSEKGECA